MWSKAWVLPRVSLSGLFIYSPNQSLFWRLYLIRLSLSLGWKNGLDLQPFRSASPGSSVISCLSVFPALDELSEENIFLNLNKIFYMYMCVPACLLCVCHVYADACGSQKIRSSGTGFPRQWTAYSRCREPNMNSLQDCFWDKVSESRLTANLPSSLHCLPNPGITDTCHCSFLIARSVYLL